MGVGAFRRPLIWVVTELNKNLAMKAYIWGKVGKILKEWQNKLKLHIETF